MDQDQVLSLFEVFWFYNKIIPKPHTSLSPINSNPIQDKTQIEKPAISSIRILHQRSLSNELSSKFDIFSPNSVLPTPRLNKIFSGKESEESKERITKQEADKRKKRTMVDRRRNRCKMSVSELEVEELKGFMDLDFTFSEEEMDSRLISIVPRLKRLGKKMEKEEAVDEFAVSRPYLSEAWKVDRREESPLMNWSIPAVKNETEMKDHLRLWARTVASTVR